MWVSDSVIRFWRKDCRRILAFCWTLGLLLGLYAASGAQFPIASWMRSAAQRPVSIVLLFTLSTFPFLLSAFAVFLKKPLLLLFLALGKGTILSFTAYGVWRSFGGAGWLVWGLYLFSDLGSMPVLYGYWRAHISGQRGFSLLPAAAVCSLCLWICSIDHQIIAPFLGGLIDF